MGFTFGQATAGVHQLVTSFNECLPYLAIAAIVFVAFYVGGILLKKGTLTIGSTQFSRTYARPSGR
jgi:hypothetical protein